LSRRTPLGGVEVVLFVRLGHASADLVEGEGPDGVQQQRDQVDQAFERLHACRIILGRARDRPRSVAVRLRRGTVV
jgi:hypothetical protein